MPHKNDVCLNKQCRHPWALHDGEGCSQCPGYKCKKFEFTAPSAHHNITRPSCARFASKSSSRIYNAVAWQQGDFSCNCTGWRNNRTCWHIEDMKRDPLKFKNNNKTTRVVSPTETTNIINDMKVKLAAAKSNPSMYAQNAQTFYNYLRKLHGMFLANRTSRRAIPYASA